MFKVNNKNTKTSLKSFWSFFLLLTLNIFYTFLSSVFIVDFEQVNVSQICSYFLDVVLFVLLTLNIVHTFFYRKFSFFSKIYSLQTAHDQTLTCQKRIAAVYEWPMKKVSPERSPKSESRTLCPYFSLTPAKLHFCEVWEMNSDQFFCRASQSQCSEAEAHTPAGIYLFKVNNRNTRTLREICSKLKIKTPERRHWPCSGVFIVNFEHTSRLVLVSLLLTLSK